MALTDYFQDLTKAASERISNIGGALNQSADIGRTKRTFSYDVFPSDLGSAYYDHYMTITAMVADSLVKTPTNDGTYIGNIGSERAEYSVGMFIPGSGGQTTINYTDSHDYVDIKLSNVMGAAVGGFFGTGDPTATVKALGAAAGHPINPGVEVLYRSTELRKFMFVFLMSPTNEKESQSMKNIIKRLRMYAAPESNTKLGGYVYNSPAEFVIKFYHKGQENTNIPRIRRCVITGIDANFTPTGEWSTFSNGHPVSCQLTINFREMEIIHRKLVEDGY